MEENKVNQTEIDKKKNFWIIGAIGVSVYMLGYMAGIRYSDIRVNESYNKGVMDAVKATILKQD